MSEEADRRYAEHIRECVKWLNEAVAAASKDGLRVELSVTETYGFIGHEKSIPPSVEVQVWRRA